MATQKTTTKTAATSATKAVKTDGGTRQMLQVISKRDGFRRAGCEWHGTTEVPLDELTEEQFEQLQTEPMLVTTLLDVPADQVDELSAAGTAAGGATGT